MSKCPKCDTTFTAVSMEKVPAKKGYDSLPCVSFNCPSCGASLGVSVDPHRFIEELKKHLR